MTEKSPCACEDAFPNQFNKPEQRWGMWRERLKQRRIDSGLNRHAIQILTGSHNSTIKAHENGRRKPNIVQLMKYLDAIGLELKIVEKRKRS